MNTTPISLYDQTSFSISVSQYFFTILMVFVMSSLLTAMNMNCCEFKNCMCIPALYRHSHSTSIFNTGMVAQQLFKEQYPKANDLAKSAELKKKFEIVIDTNSNLLAYLSSKEIDILKGIILANGMTYYQVCSGKGQVDEDSFRKFATEFDI